jgi:co-chaperonin GroES (HSP10)
MVENKSGITPVGETVVVLPDEVEEKSAGGIIIGSPSDVERMQLAQVDGVLVAVSPQAWADEKYPRAVLGDKVIFAKYSGMVRKGSDGRTYRLINDTDIKAVLDKEES